jgi:hypothetical protein
MWTRPADSKSLAHPIAHSAPPELCTRADRRRAQFPGPVVGAGGTVPVAFLGVRGRAHLLPCSRCLLTFLCSLLHK